MMLGHLMPIATIISFVSRESEYQLSTKPAARYRIPDGYQVPNWVQTGRRHTQYRLGRAQGFGKCVGRQRITQLVGPELSDDVEHPGTCR